MVTVSMNHRYINPESAKLRVVPFFPPASAVEGIKPVPSVCVCVTVGLSVIQRSDR